MHLESMLLTSRNMSRNQIRRELNAYAMHYL